MCKGHYTEHVAARGHPAEVTSGQPAPASRKWDEGVQVSQIGPKFRPIGELSAGRSLATTAALAGKALAAELPHCPQLEFRLSWTRSQHEPP